MFVLLMSKSLALPPPKHPALMFRMIDSVSERFEQTLYLSFSSIYIRRMFLIETPPFKVNGKEKAKPINIQIED